MSTRTVSSHIVAVEFVSMDGVLQAPGTTTEDPCNFAHGGWSRPYFADHQSVMSGLLDDAGALLMGRRTHDIFAAAWPGVTDSANLVATAFRRLPRYVTSTSLVVSPWPGTTVLRNLVEVADMAADAKGHVVIIGSGRLLASMLALDLVDQLHLLVHPVMLGEGKRLTTASVHMSAWAVESVDAMPTGLIRTIYRREPAGARQSVEAPS